MNRPTTARLGLAAITVAIALSGTVFFVWLERVQGDEMKPPGAFTEELVYSRSDETITNAGR